MLVELKGVGVENKGAYLILEAVLNEFKQRKIEANFCAKIGFGMDYEVQKNLNFGNRLAFSNVGKKQLFKNLIYSTYSGNAKRKHNIVTNNKIDLILDGSGFAYGDFWGSRKIYERLDNVLRNKIKNNTPVILLPQALGPFTNKDVKIAFGKVVNKVDLIFARDQISYQNLIECFGEQPHFRKAPDFTNLLNVDAMADQRDIVYIIPNYKMIRGESYTYTNFLVQTVNILLNRNEKVQFLIHEGKKDKKIAEEINHMIGMNLPIIEKESPLDVKRLIKASKLVVVSRFHGLVSALCQGVPVIATSWSHKYEMLLKDYDQQEDLIDINSFNKLELKQLVDGKCEIDIKQYRASKQDKIQAEKQKTKAMWDMVFDLIAKGVN